MLRKPVFWILFGLVFVASVIFTVSYFSRAFPIVNIEISMDRQQALRKAEAFVREFGLGPEESRRAASFRLETSVQNYVELEAGGTDAFNRMVEDRTYSPYTWQVRFFQEGEVEETLVRFTPDGQLYGFVEKLPEDQPGEGLPADSARVIAEISAMKSFDVDLTTYDLVEASKELRTGGRMDHTFVYERSNDRIGEGRYRLRLVIAGDRLTELSHFIKIPESFERRFEEMRSANNTIASSALVAVGLLYIIGGCIIGLFFLLRKRWVLWRKALFWALFIAFLQFLAGINRWPLTWMDYDTALSAQGFLSKQILILLVNSLLMAVLLGLSFIAAESLSRKAFPHHIQHWRIWSRGVAGSPQVLGRTVAGYLFVALFFAYEVSLYFLSTEVLGWWSPSDALFQPDILANYFPWFSSIAISAQAGFWEECLFRAIPIAGAALIGQRYGGRKAWIAAAFIVQALIFGSAHANYPNQPAYARLVELIIPSLAFGAIYLSFGLLPSIVLHYTVDVVWFSMPLFVSKAPGVWTDQVFVVVLTFIPLLVVLAARLRNGKWAEVALEDYNRSWTPPPLEVPEPAREEVTPGTGIKSTARRLVFLGGLAGLILWLSVSTFETDAPPLSISRQDVSQLAKKSLADRGIELPGEWRTLTAVDSLVGRGDRFVWQVGGRELYRDLLGKYLPPPQWKVRFVRFEGDVAERAEEYQVFVAGDGEIRRFRHLLPEARPGSNLDRDEARARVDSVLPATYRVDLRALKEVSAVPTKLPDRIDWEFTFADTSGYRLEEGEARIVVKLAGSEVADTFRTIHVPEEWVRQDRNRSNVNNILKIVCSLLLVVMLLSAAVGAVVNWSRKNFSVSVFITFFSLVLILHVIKLINGWPGVIAGFSTAEPLSNQTYTAIVFSLLGGLFLAGGLALVTGFLQMWKREQLRKGTMETYLLGSSLGLLMAGAAAVVTRFAPSLEPVWARYEALESYMPVLGEAVKMVGIFILSAVVILFVFVATDRSTHNWTRKKGFFVFIFLLIGLVTTGVDGINDFTFWLIEGLLAGVIYLIAYRFIFRFQLSLVPPAIGVVAAMAELKQGLLNAYPGALSGAVLAVIGICALSYYWCMKLGDTDLPAT